MNILVVRGVCGRALKKYQPVIESTDGLYSNINLVQVAHPRRENDGLVLLSRVLQERQVGKVRGRYLKSRNANLIQEINALLVPAAGQHVDVVISAMLG